MLHIASYTKSSLSSNGVRLDPVATSYPVSWIETTRNIPGYITSDFTTHHKKEPLNEALV